MQVKVILIMTISILLSSCTSQEQLAPLPVLNTSIEREVVFEQLEQASFVEEEKEDINLTMPIYEDEEKDVTNKESEKTFEELLQSQDTQKKAEQLQNPTFQVQQGSPDPEIHSVRIFAGSGRELFPDQYGVYEIPSRIVNMFVVDAENKGNPFQLRIRSPKITFQQKSFSLNLRFYADKNIKSKYAKSNNVYYLEVDTPLQDSQYPYFFITDDFASSKKHHFFVSVVDADRTSLKNEVDIVYRLV